MIRGVWKVRAMPRIARNAGMPLVEAPLHREQLFHRRAEAAREGGLLRRDDSLTRLDDRVRLVPTVLLELERKRANREPQEHRVQEHRRDGLVGADAFVGVRQAEANERADLVAFRALQQRGGVAEEITQQVVAHEQIEALLAVPTVKELQQLVE